MKKCLKFLISYGLFLCMSRMHAGLVPLLYKFVDSYPTMQYDISTVAWKTREGDSITKRENCLSTLFFAFERNYHSVCGGGGGGMASGSS